MSDEAEPLNVLFICTGNSARSILGEAILNREGQGRFRGYSCGSYPSGAVDPNTIRLLESLSYETKGLRSKSWDEFSQSDAPKLDFVFTVCDNAAAEVCPVWPGQPVSAHWGIPDPAAVQGSQQEIAVAFAEAYRMMNRRIALFINLPHAALDRLSLQHHVEEIHRRADET
jgi:arsenate reductase